MKLTFYKASDKNGRAKATIHKSGKLGFSSEAIGYLGIKEDTFIKFAQNEEDKSDLNLYAMLSDVQDDESFRICKSGNYYYVGTTRLFNEIGVDFTKTTIIYDLIKIDSEVGQIIKLSRRDINKRKKGGFDELA